MSQADVDRQSSMHGSTLIILLSNMLILMLPCRVCSCRRPCLPLLCAVHRALYNRRNLPYAGICKAGRLCLARGPWKVLGSQTPGAGTLRRVIWV